MNFLYDDICIFTPE